jgi:hypothetical protein
MVRNHRVIYMEGCGRFRDILGQSSEGSESVRKFLVTPNECPEGQTLVGQVGPGPHLGPRGPTAKEGGEDQLVSSQFGLRGRSPSRTQLPLPGRLGERSPIGTQLPPPSRFGGRSPYGTQLPLHEAV